MSNLPYKGGLLVHDFVLGFNYVKNKFIYDVLELNEQGTIRLMTPLINTKMYKRFIDNSRCPIVIKSISFYNNLKGIYDKFVIGKFGDQASYNVITYNIAQIATTENDSKYINVKRSYQTLNIEYFYYNGNRWILDNENVGGNSDKWYQVTKNNIGIEYNEHLFDFPSILIPYLNPYHKLLSKNKTQTNAMNNAMN